MKRIITLLLSLACCVGFLSCQNNTDGTTVTTTASDDYNSTTDISTETQEEPMQILDRNYDLTKQQEFIKVQGRSHIAEDGLACDATASGIEFCAYIEGTVTLSVNATAETYFTVTVDSVRMQNRLKANAGKSVLELASFADGGIHTIGILKQTEARLSLCSFSSLHFKGYPQKAPAKKAHYVEFIGDSITCGYGILCANGTENGGSALYQDGTQTFAFLAAQKWNADHSMISCSGIGITQGSASVPYVASQLFFKQSVYRSQTQDFVPARVPDLVVINLGTNDSANAASTSQFMKDVSALIDLIRTTYGKDVPIVWVYNMMNDSLFGSARLAIAAKGGENAGIYTCQLNQNRDGGVGHPSLAAHATAAEQLASFVQEKGLLS